MFVQHAPRPHVCREGDRSYIVVPSGESQALSEYLRRLRLAASLPLPHTDGTDVIELRGIVNDEAVQNLLSRLN
jgi:hypothetical protein